jgi:hypothetical protein
MLVYVFLLIFWMHSKFKYNRLDNNNKSKIPRFTCKKLKNATVIII